MKNLFKRKTSLLFVGIMTAMVLVLSSCNEDDPVPEVLPTETIMDLVDGTNDLSTLKAAIDAAMLREVLNGTGPFTVFAPTNAAFAEIDEDVLAYLLATPEELTKVLTYHVVAGAVLSTDLVDGPVTTLNGGDVVVDLSGGGVKINDANVTTADVLATNGVVHIIDKVLIPEDLMIPELRNIVEIAAATPSLSILVEALTLYPDLVGLLSAPGTNTVFAPDNDAFVALLGVIKQNDLSDIPEDVLENVLVYHVITSAAIASSELVDGQTAETAGGEDATVTINNDGVFISGSQVTTPDILASNGIIHIMKDVMVPPSILPFVGNVMTYEYFNKDFTTLVAAIGAASPSILTTLQSENLTLFAPTNAAFTAAGITELPTDMATIDAILAYHLLTSVVKAADLPVTGAAAPATVPSAGGDLYISNRGGDAGVFINGSTQVTATDILADEANGSVTHVINRTLVPPSMSIAALAAELNFTKLVEALVEAGLAQTFIDPGNYTVFAPNDAAFDALYASLNISGPSEVDGALGAGTLEAVLTYHVLGARVFSSDLEDGLEATTLQTGKITVNVTTEGVTLTDLEPDNTDANVIVTDQLATNGVVHAIDAVLLPVDL